MFLSAKLKDTYDITRAAFNLLVMAAALATGIWYFIDDEVGDKVRRFTGVEDAVMAIQTTNQNVKVIEEKLVMNAREAASARQNLETQLGRVENRIEALEPRNRVFVIDELRSLVHEDCPTDGLCKYTFIVRREPKMANCEIIQMRQFVIDRFGVTHPVQKADGRAAQAASGSWTDITDFFMLPSNVPTGVAEFYAELTYGGCFPDKPEQKVKERTTHLIFEIKQP